MNLTTGNDQYCACAHVDPAPCPEAMPRVVWVWLILTMPPVLRHGHREREMREEVEGMKVELSRANSLIKSLQQRGGEVLLMSPAAAKASALLKSGMTLTQIYSKYVEVRLS